MGRTVTDRERILLSFLAMLSTTDREARKQMVRAAAHSSADMAAFRGILAGVVAGGLLWLALATLLF